MCLLLRTLSGTMPTILEGTSTEECRISGSSSHVLLSAWYPIPLRRKISLSARRPHHPAVVSMGYAVTLRHRQHYANGGMHNSLRESYIEKYAVCHSYGIIHLGGY